SATALYTFSLHDALPILAAQDAVIGVVDVGIDDVGGAVADLASAGDVRKSAEGVEVARAEETQGFVFGEAFACDRLVVEVAQFGDRKSTRLNSSHSQISY